MPVLDEVFPVHGHNSNWKEGEIWEEEERLHFHSAYIRFSKAFHMAHGEKLDLTVSDAFLVYIEIYGYEKIKEETDREIFRGFGINKCNFYCFLN